MNNLASVGAWLAGGLGVVLLIYVVAKVIGYGLTKGVIKAITQRSNKHGS